MSSSYSIPPLQDASLLKNQAFVNGQWISARSGLTFEVTDPATTKVIGTMPDMDKSDVEEAIDAAAAALPEWRKVIPRQRGRLLHKLFELMTENLDDLAKLICWENGKSLVDARYEAEYAASHIEWFSEEAPRIYGDTIPASSDSTRIYTLKQPIGVCGLIAPWNWPAGMITRKLGPALAAGCTVVIKSAGDTPLTAAALAELAHRAGFPPGVVNVVSAHHNTAEVGATLTDSVIVKKVSFTGSTRVGAILMKQAAATVKKLSFELGGNAPFIVFDDACLEQAVDGAIANKFRSSGQTCVCANRIYIQRGIYDAFTKAFVAKVNEFKIGPGYAEGTTHGPMIHERGLEKVREHIADAVAKGGNVLAGGEKIPELGPLFHQLTVIGNMNHEMKLAHEETFGPVAGLFEFDTEEEVLRYANDANVGLGGFFYSQDVSRCHRVAEALEVGMVGVNNASVSDVASPFGGVKESGFGREGSKYGIEEYLTIKSVIVGI